GIVSIRVRIRSLLRGFVLHLRLRINVGIQIEERNERTVELGMLSPEQPRLLEKDLDGNRKELRGVGSRVPAQNRLSEPYALHLLLYEPLPCSCRLPVEQRRHPIGKLAIKIEEVGKLVQDDVAPVVRPSPALLDGVNRKDDGALRVCHPVVLGVIAIEIVLVESIRIKKHRTVRR